MHSQSAAGKKGAAGAAEAIGRNPTDRAKCGVKRHLSTDGKGVPSASALSGANRTDMKKLGDLLDAQGIEMPALVDGQGQPSVPSLCLDRGHDHGACREVAAAHGYISHIPPKASAARPLPLPGDPARHPPRRWVVGAGHAWFNRFRRVLIRWEKKAVNSLGFVQLAAHLIVYRTLRHVQLLSG